MSEKRIPPVAYFKDYLKRSPPKSKPATGRQRVTSRQVSKTPVIATSRITKRQAVLRRKSGVTTLEDFVWQRAQAQRLHHVMRKRFADHELGHVVIFTFAPANPDHDEQRIIDELRETGWIYGVSPDEPHDAGLTGIKLFPDPIGALRNYIVETFDDDEIPSLLRETYSSLHIFVAFHEALCFFGKEGP